MTIITENHPKWSVYSRLPKCGEITASEDGVLFGLNCSRCPIIFCCIEEFLNHQQEQHVNEQHIAFEDHQQQKEKPQTTPLQNRKRRRRRSQQASSPGSSSNHDELPKRTLRTRSCTLSPAVVAAAIDAAAIDVAPIDAEVDPLQFVDACSESSPIIQEEDDLETVHLKEEVYIEVEPGVTYFGSEAEDDELTLNSKIDSEDDHDDHGYNINNNKLLNFKQNLLSLENREIVSYIIEVYQQNPMLWDVGHVLHPFYNKKIQILKEMKKEIWIRFKLTLEYADIREAFECLRKSYNEALLNDIEDQHLRNVKRKLKSNRTETSKLWCFEKLEFLKPHELAENTRLQLTIDQYLQLAEIYKHYSLLWHSDGDASHDKLQMATTQSEMLQEANEKMNLNMTLKQLRLQIKRLRAIYSANKSRRISCEENDEEFVINQPPLYAKLKFLEPFVGPFHCERCNDVITTYRLFKVHVAEHDGQLPYKCCYCTKDFKNFSLMAAHRRTHTKEKPYVCTICEADFSSLTGLKVHQTHHNGEKKYVCHICGAAYRTGTTLHQHKERRHNPNRARYQCDNCPKSFTEKAALRGHMNMHQEKRCAVCPVCDKGFFTRKTMREHMHVHDEVKQFMCEICDKKFAQKSGLSTHRRKQHNIIGSKESPTLQGLVK